MGNRHHPTCCKKEFIVVVGWLALFLICPEVFSETGLHLDLQAQCLEEAELQASTQRLLGSNEKSKYISVVISEVRKENGAIVFLRILGRKNGGLILEREFDLKKEDCPNSAELLVVVLQQFLVDFKLEDWPLELDAIETSNQKPEKIVLTKETSTLSGLGFLSVAGRLLPWSGDLTLGAALDMGSNRHRLVGSLAFRLGVPQPLGTGSYLESLMLLGVGWRYGSKDWIVRTEVRTGALLVTGFGYTEDKYNWLLWLEIQTCWLWQVGSILLGPEVAVSPLQHKVQTAEGDTQSLPFFRVGLTIGFPFWSKLF